MKKIIGILALFLAVTACNTAAIDSVPEDNDGNGIPFSATIRTTATKALEDAGIPIASSWAVNDEIALVYNDGTARKDVMRISSIDGSGVATITGTLSGKPADNTEVTVIYPASEADGTTGNLSHKSLRFQDGTPDFIGANLGFCKGTGKLSISAGKASFEKLVALLNQCAIFKFTLRETDGKTPINVNSMVICIDGVDYNVHRKMSKDILLVALPALSGKAISFKATDENSVNYYCSYPEFTYPSRKIHQVTLKMSSQLGIPGTFTVNKSGKKVIFSKGNLQWFYGGNVHKTSDTSNDDPIGTAHYNGGVFVFADRQFEIRGKDNAGENRVMVNISSSINHFTPDCKVDLFMYASSGFRSDGSGGNYHYKPFAVNNGGFWPNKSRGYGGILSIAETTSDWGVFNAILNGGDEPGIWRTLTKDEWFYIFNDRLHSLDYRGYATVCEVRGIILLPDDWDGPAINNNRAALYIDNPADQSHKTDDIWNKNVYTEAAWDAMEAKGAVFLPASGYQSPDGGAQLNCYSVDRHNAIATYWTSSSIHDSGVAYSLDLGRENGDTYWRFSSGSRCFGRAVRLVRDAN